MVRIGDPEQSPNVRLALASTIGPCARVAQSAASDKALDAHVCLSLQWLYRSPDPQLRIWLRHGRGYLPLAGFAPTLRQVRADGRGYVPGRPCGSSLPGGFGRLNH